MMQAVAESGAGPLPARRRWHMNIFGVNPVVVFGTPEQKQRMLPPLIAGHRQRRALPSTEPDAGARYAPAQDQGYARRGPLTSCPGRKSGFRPRRSPARC